MLREWSRTAGSGSRLRRRFSGTSGDATTNAYYYAGEELAVLRVSLPSDDLLRLEAESVLPIAVYSHLNSFCTFQVAGHRRLFLAFSPIPAQRIEVTYSEYPVGRPSRFAYVDAASQFHVVEAESGEKGPFRELAHGPLPAGASLGVTLFDELEPIAQIDLLDFASQARRNHRRPLDGVRQRTRSSSRCVMIGPTRPRRSSWPSPGPPSAAAGTALVMRLACIETAS